VINSNLALSLTVSEIGLRRFEGLKTHIFPPPLLFNPKFENNPFQLILRNFVCEKLSYLVIICGIIFFRKIYCLATLYALQKTDKRHIVPKTRP